MNEDTQRKYIEIQILEQQIKQIQKNLEILNQQIFELNMISNSLTEIKKTKIGQELLVPLGSGIFIKTELKDNNEILTNVGSDVVVSKTNAETKTFIKSQTEFVIEMITKIEQELHLSISKYEELKEDLQELVKKK